jgi:hypothetical protein
VSPTTEISRLHRPPIDWTVSVERLRTLLLTHGVLGQSHLQGSYIFVGELARMQIARLVFLLLPRLAVSTETDAPRYIKPVIEEHLVTLGVAIDEELIEILKRVSDQIRATEPTLPRRLKKMTVGEVRARNRRKYKTIRNRQNDRCKTCGVLLDTVQEELDHVIPWRIVGDTPDGSNWQLLCPCCNNSKGAYISTHQFPEAWNWVYSTINASLHQPTSATRFVVLAEHASCNSCGRATSEAELTIVNRSKHGMFLTDHLDVICTECRDALVHAS